MFLKIKRSALTFNIGVVILATSLLWVAGCAAPPPTAAPTLVSTPAFSDALVRKPYLQSVTSDSIIVAWETGDSSRGEVV